MNLVVYSDGGVHADNKEDKPCYYAFVVYCDDMYVGSLSAENLGTSNQAEYKGLLLALRGIEKHINPEFIKSVHFISDSKILVNQMKGIFKVRDEKLKKINTLAKKYVSNYTGRGTDITFEHKRREHNSLTDGFCNLVKIKIFKTDFYQTLEEFSTLHNLKKNKVFKKYVKEKA